MLQNHSDKNILSNSISNAAFLYEVIEGNDVTDSNRCDNSTFVMTCLEMLN